MKVWVVEVMPNAESELTADGLVCCFPRVDSVWMARNTDGSTDAPVKYMKTLKCICPKGHEQSPGATLYEVHPNDEL